MPYFPILRTEYPTDTEKYSEEIRLLQQEINSRFQDICKCEAAINLFSMPLDINFQIVPAGFQTKMADLQCDTNLRNTRRHVRLLSY
jgi:hypothetical protein